MSLLSEKDLTEKLEQFRVLLKKLPPENYNNLRLDCFRFSDLYLLRMSDYVFRAKRLCKLFIIIHYN